MENNPIYITLYNTPSWKVLSYFLQNPERFFNRMAVVKALPKVSKAAVYDAIKKLLEIGAILKEEESDRYGLNQTKFWVQQLKVLDSLIILNPMVTKLSKLAGKVVLFGSRASGEYQSDSDFDLLVVSSKPEDVRKIIYKNPLKEQMQLLIKTPEDWIDFGKTEPNLYQSIQKGIVLWEQN